MATRQRGLRRRLASLVTTFWRLLLVGAFTGVETGALVVWLALVDGATPLSRTAALGLGILAVGLVVEHVLTDVTVNGLDFSFPLGSIVLISASEAVLWALWLGVADRVGGVEGVFVAGVVLLVLLVPQHTIEDNVLRGLGALSTLVDRRTVGFSLVEAAGATGWLLLVDHPDAVVGRLKRWASSVEPAVTGVDVGPLAGSVPSVDPAVAGVGVLALALLVEHLIGVSFSRRSG